LAELISLEEAQAKLLALASKMPTTPGGEPFGLTQFLSEDLKALRTQPETDLSAMDGYAIAGDGPWLKVGESRAGTAFGGALKAGECTRISTGASMPDGSDRVLIQENATIDGDLVSLADGEELPPPWRHVRKAGFDFKEGDLLLKKGIRMGAGQVALSRAGGYDFFPHYETPNIAVLQSGDELSARAHPLTLRPGQLPASNGVMIEEMLRPYLLGIEQIGPIPDQLEELMEALERLESHQIIITSGGASVGDHDLMQQALINWGAELAFWKVAIKPGKPLMVANRDKDGHKQVILGLPGNPVSSFVTCFLFALPLVRKMMGDPDPLPKSMPATLGVDLPAIGSRQEFLRGVWDGETVVLAASQDSSALQALAASNCLINRQPHAGAASIGDRVSIYPL